MENKYEDEIRKRWETEAREKQQQECRVVARPKKRLRELEYVGSDAAGVARLLEDGTMTSSESSDAFPSLEDYEKDRSEAKTKANRRQSGRSVGTRAAAARARGKVVQELIEEETVELD